MRSELTLMSAGSIWAKNTPRVAVSSWGGMRNIVALALVFFTLPISAWSQLVPAEDTGKDDIRKTGDNDAPLFDPATSTFHGECRAY